MNVSDSKSRAWDALSQIPRISTIAAGIFESEGTAEVKHTREGEHGSPLTVAELANIHEFGALVKDETGEVIGEIPARSFLRAWFDENETRIQAVFADRLAALGPENWRQALEQLALWIQGDIQRRMRAGLHPDIAQETKDRKGSSKPLIDTGQLLAAITAMIVADTSS